MILDGDKLEGDLQDRKLDELQKVQFVFQMADTALNPKKLIGEIIGQAAGVLSWSERQGKAPEGGSEILDLVELPPEFASRYPMELSGGQKQRINLARSLGC